MSKSEHPFSEPENAGKPLRNGIKGLEKLELVKGSGEKSPEGNLTPKVRRSIERKILNRQTKIEEALTELETAETSEALQALINDGKLEDMTSLLEEQRNIAEKESLGHIDHRPFEEKVTAVRNLSKKLVEKLLKKEPFNRQEFFGASRDKLVPKKIEVPEAREKGEGDHRERMANELLGAAVKDPETMQSVFVDKLPKATAEERQRKTATPQRGQGPESEETHPRGLDDIIFRVETSGLVEGRTKDISGTIIGKEIRRIVSRFEGEEFQQLSPDKKKRAVLGELDSLTSDERLKSDLLDAFREKGWMPAEVTPPQETASPSQEQKKGESSETPPSLSARLTEILAEVEKSPGFEREYNGEVVKEVTGAEIADSIRVFAEGTQTEGFRQKTKAEQARNILDFIQNLCTDERLQTDLRVMFRDAGLLEKRERSAKVTLSSSEKKLRAFKQADQLGKDVDDVPAGILSAKHLPPENELAPFMKGARESVSSRAQALAEERRSVSPEAGPLPEAVGSFEEKLDKILARVKNTPSFERGYGDRKEQIDGKTIAKGIRTLVLDFQSEGFMKLPKVQQIQEISDSINVLSTNEDLRQDLRSLFSSLPLGSETVRRASPQKPTPTPGQAKAPERTVDLSDSDKVMAGLSSSPSAKKSEEPSSYDRMMAGESVPGGAGVSSGQKPLNDAEILLADLAQMKASKKEASVSTPAGQTQTEALPRKKRWYEFFTKSTPSETPVPEVAEAPRPSEMWPEQTSQASSDAEELDKLLASAKAPEAKQSIPFEGFSLSSATATEAPLPSRTEGGARTETFGGFKAGDSVQLIDSQGQDGWPKPRFIVAFEDRSTAPEYPIIFAKFDDGQIVNITSLRKVNLQDVPWSENSESKTEGVTSKDETGSAIPPPPPTESLESQRERALESAKTLKEGDKVMYVVDGKEVWSNPRTVARVEDIGEVGAPNIHAIFNDGTAIDLKFLKKVSETPKSEAPASLTRERIEALTFEGLFELDDEMLLRVVKDNTRTSVAWGIAMHGMPEASIARVRTALENCKDEAYKSTRQFDDWLGAIRPPVEIEEERQVLLERSKEILLKSIS